MRTGDHIAVIFRDQLVSGEEFLLQYEICSLFMKQHVHTGGRVAILHRKSPELITLLYTCYQDGITFIPIDPEYPDDRINAILEEVKPALVVADSMNASRVNEYVVYVSTEILHQRHPGRNIDNLSSLLNISSDIDPVSTIYFTSGTTGKPKGVMVTKNGQINHIESIGKIIDFSQVSRMACLTSISFDLFFHQSILALHYSLTVVVADGAEQNDPRRLAELIIRHKIDILSVTPSTLNLIWSFDRELQCMKDVRIIILGGEKFPEFMLKLLQEKLTARIYNMYGPTEASVYATISDLTERDVVDIGRPLPNYEIFILDDQHRTLPAGQKGEIAIAGAGLAKGYLNREEMTRTKFIILPEYGNKRVYLTGDVGEIAPDGNLRCLGRIDNQIKWRGFRIELEEIEHTAMQYPGILQCVASLEQVAGSGEMLAAWYTGEFADPEHLRLYLSNKLPDYMIPARYYNVADFRYTANGKLSRDISGLQIVERILTQSPDQEELSELQKTVLYVVSEHVEESLLPVSINTNLRSVGIDSIKFVEIMVSLEETLHLELEEGLLLFTGLESVATLVDQVKKTAEKEPQR